MNWWKWKAMKSQRGSFMSQFHCVHLFWFIFFSSFSRHLSFICRILCKHHYLISCLGIIPVSTHLQFISEENRKGKRIVLYSIFNIHIYVCLLFKLYTGSNTQKKKGKKGEKSRECQTFFFLFFIFKIFKLIPWAV